MVEPDKIRERLRDVHELREELEEAAASIEEQELEKIEDRVEFDASGVDVEKRKEFERRPYLIDEVDDTTYRIFVPFYRTDFTVGRFVDQVGTYNVFELDNISKLITGIPEELEEDIDLEEGDLFKVRGGILEYDDEGHEKLEGDRELENHLDEIGDDHAVIKTGSEFELIADLIERGEFPFTPQPVADEDLRDPDIRFELRSYQQDGLDHVLENGNACFCWPTGSGKTFPALAFLDKLRYDPETARKAIVCVSRMTKDQMRQYCDEYAPRLFSYSDPDKSANPEYADRDNEVEFYTYHSIDKMDGEYIAVVFDEAHRLPANTFAKAATVPMKYRLGLTASPYREDGRSSYIYALTGDPIGLNWEENLALQGKEYHDINVHVLEDTNEKIDTVGELLEDHGDLRTLIFSDSLDVGHRIADRYDLRFVNGDDTAQLEKLQEALEEDGTVVVSRVGDHGLSVDPEAVIEVDFLYGSRNQEIQRTGRLFHSDEGQRHDILFTGYEFDNYQKRLYGLVEKGFSLNFIGADVDVEVPDKYESKVSTSIEVEDNDNDRGSVRGDPGSMDAMDILKHEDLDAESMIEKAMDDAPVSPDPTVGKKAVLFVVRSDEAVTSSELAAFLDYSRDTANKILKSLTDQDLLAKERGQHGYEYRFNIEELRERIRAKNEVRELEDQIEDDVDDVF